LRDLLAAEKRRFGRFARADVYLSDAHARMALVPWQANLRTATQANAYGRAMLESRGMVSEEGWSVHSGFRHCGEAGLASALPSALVDRLKGELADVGVALRSALPVSAAAYWYHRPAHRKGTSVLLLDEPGRLTAAIHVAGRLCALDVEPVVGPVGLAAGRIEKRVQLRCTQIQHVEVHAPTVAEWRPDRLAGVFENAGIMMLPRVRWSAA
jgi:hypothetical protein